jgi:hypothetical protein
MSYAKTHTSGLLHEMSYSDFAYLVEPKEKQGALIERLKGEPPAPGKFAPIFNVITDKGRRLLQEQFL